MDAFSSAGRTLRARWLRRPLHHASPRSLRHYVRLISISSALLLMVLAGGSLLLWTGSPARAAPADDLTVLKFNELLSNPKQDWNGDGQPLASDQWIELANHSSSAVSLAGLQVLSEGANNNQPLLLPLSYNIGANGFLTIFIKQIPQIRLFPGGGMLELLDGEGAIIDSVGYPALDSDFSYARASGGQWAITSTPTPGAANIITGGTNPQPSPTPTRSTGGGGGGGGGSSGTPTATPTPNGTVTLPTDTAVTTFQNQGASSSSGPGGNSDQSFPSWVKIGLIVLIGITLLVVVIWYIRSWRPESEGRR
jgi:hypothetical protein